MDEKIYDGGEFVWKLKLGDMTGEVNAKNLGLKFGDFGDNLPRSISVKSPVTGAVKTFELIELEDNGLIQTAIYRAHIENVGNVTLCIYNR